MTTRKLKHYSLIGR
jgi:ribonuclease HI